MSKFQGRIHNPLFNQRGDQMGNITILTEGSSLERHAFTGLISSRRVLEGLVETAMDKELIGFKLVPMYRNERA